MSEYEMLTIQSVVDEFQVYNKSWPDQTISQETKSKTTEYKVRLKCEDTTRYFK